MAAIEENIPISEDSKVRDKNVFNKELLSVLKPFDLMQALYISSMYRVRDGFIIPNSVFYNVVSGVWVLLLSFSYFFSIFKNVFTAELEGFNFVKCSTNIPIFFIFFFGNMSTYWTNVKQRHNNVRLAISIQNICEMLHTNGKSLKNFKLLNWIYVIALNLFRVILIFNINMVYSFVFKLDEIILKLFHVIFDIKILYYGRLMKLLSEPLRVWVDDARKTMSEYTDSGNELYWDRKFRAYIEIVETYEIIGYTFQTVVLYYCIDLFVNSLISIWIRIEIAKLAGVSMIRVALSLLSLIWIVKSMLLLTALCSECERFYSNMKEVRGVCIQLTTSGTCPEAQKRVSKNIQRVQTASFKKMSACGLFVIDGTLPLLLCGLLTTYIIVVLQFEFL